MTKLAKLSSAIAGFFLLSSTVFAFNGDISINSQGITFSTQNFLEGRTARIYATAKNNSAKDLLGTIRYYDNDKQIGGDQPISIFDGSTDGVFIDWTPSSHGSHKIAVKIFPWQPEIDDPSNNWVVTNINVIQDTDHDGIPNSSDPDDDNDGVPDTEDAFPLNPNEQYDTDGDGKGDNTDTDDDNDGVPDEFDDLPLDPDETIDTDGDGIGNIADPDDDNDGITDTTEENTGTNPLEADTDKDGTNDNEDAFPINQNEQHDTDKDSIGNNADIDDDNDGITDDKDKFPLNKGPVIKISTPNRAVDLLRENTFDASPSYDEDGTIVSYEWEIDGEKVREGNSLDYIFKKLGNHTVKLTVTDDSGESRISEFQINVFNISLFKQIGLALIVILLASIIYFKYIAEAKNPKDSTKQS